jgi:hypothetical protein
MTATIGPIVLTTGVLISLCLMTLETMGLWAAIILGVVGLVFVGRQLALFQD